MKFHQIFLEAQGKEEDDEVIIIDQKFAPTRFFRVTFLGGLSDLFRG